MKKYFKKLGAVVLAAVLLIGSVCSASATGEKQRYQDVSFDAWYYDAVEFTTALGVMDGVGNRMFAPAETVSRAMFITMLYRFAGCPQASGDSVKFSDVKAGAYYADAVAWGVKNDIVRGVSAEEFLPQQEITREQIACMVVRYCENIQASFLIEGPHVETVFMDEGDVSDYAKEAMDIMVYKGVYQGYDGYGYFCPQNTSTRAEAAALIMRLGMMLEKVPSCATLSVNGKNICAEHKGND